MPQSPRFTRRSHHAGKLRVTTREQAPPSTAREKPVQPRRPAMPGIKKYDFKKIFQNQAHYKLRSDTVLSRSVVSNSLRPHGLMPTRLLCPWDFPGKNTGVGCHFLLQGIFPTQGWNPGLSHCRQTFYPLSHQGSPLVGFGSDTEKR